MVKLLALACLESAAVSGLAFTDPRISQVNDFGSPRHLIPGVLSVSKHELKKVTD
jgi:hypothetical protein